MPNANFGAPDEEQTHWRNILCPSCGAKQGRACFRELSLSEKSAYDDLEVTTGVNHKTMLTKNRPRATVPCPMRYKSMKKRAACSWVGN